MSSALVLEPGRNGLPRFIYNHHSLMSLMSYTRLLIESSRFGKNR